MRQPRLAPLRRLRPHLRHDQGPAPAPAGHVPGPRPRSTTPPPATPVRLSYGVQNVAVGDGTAQELELSAIEYNLATGGACAKNRIELAYGPWNGDPGGAVDPNLPGNGNGDPSPCERRRCSTKSGTRVLRRVHVLAHGDTCGTSDQRVRLRRYQPSHNPDADTGSPRRVASDVYGRQGTAEESQRLPIGRYAQYGSATTDGKLVMEKEVLPGAPQDRVLRMSVQTSSAGTARATSRGRC